MEVKRTMMMTAIATGGPSLVKYLLGNGINAMNVQIAANTIRPVVVPSDLTAGTTIVDLLVDDSTNVSNVVSELKQGNYITNTVLRNVLAPIVLKTTPVSKRADTTDESLFATGLIQSYGFPGKS